MVAREIPVTLAAGKRLPGAAKLNYRQYRRIKRIFDLTVCLALLPLFLPLIGLLALAVRLDSPGSPFFMQTRVGQNGRRFRIYKFRTMWKDHNGQRDQAFMKAYIAGQVHLEEGRDGKVARFKPIQEKDVTRVGRLLRKTSLDELPQVINVIRGEMSLIGPRPNVVWEVEAYSPWHAERLRVLPGITGLAQVMGRSDITFDQIARFDILYARNQDLKMDLHILRQTIRSVLERDGAG